MTLRIFASAVVLILGAAVAESPGDGSSGQAVTHVATPQGIFAVYPVNDPEKDWSPEALDALLDNPAVSGVAIRERWENLEPKEGEYHLERLEQTVAAASKRHKQVQLILVPGFFTPRWLLDRLPAAEGKDCGKATFTIPYGPNRSEKRELPLPWSRPYQEAWSRFLAEVARRWNPDPAVVSIAVGGPTSVSVEMSLPAHNPEDLQTWQRLLKATGQAGTDLNAPVLEAWKQAVGTYARLFEGKTLVLTRGSGLLDSGKGEAQVARDALVAWFSDSKTKTGSNLKATQTSGMQANREEAGGIRGVKDLSGDTSFSPRILGGAQFNSALSQHPGKVGDPHRKRKGHKTGKPEPKEAEADITPLEGLRNVLKIFFNDTPAGERFSGRAGTAPIQYLQIYREDIEYANRKEDPDFQKTLEEAAQALKSFGG